MEKAKSTTLAHLRLTLVVHLAETDAWPLVDAKNLQRLVALVL